MCTRASGPMPLTLAEVGEGASRRDMKSVNRRKRGVRVGGMVNPKGGAPITFFPATAVLNIDGPGYAVPGR